MERVGRGGMPALKGDSGKEREIYQFFLSRLLLSVSYLKNLCLFQACEDSLLCFLPEALKF